MTACLGWDGNRDGDGNRDATSIHKAGGVVADGNRNVSNRSEWILVPSEVSLLGYLAPLPTFSSFSASPKSAT